MLGSRFVFYAAKGVGSWGAAAGSVFGGLTAAAGAVGALGYFLGKRR